MVNLRLALVCHLALFPSALLFQRRFIWPLSDGLVCIGSLPEQGLEMFFPVFVTDLKIVLSGQFRADATPRPISQSSRTLKG